MQITLSKFAGFCDGVARAYEMIKKAASDSKTKRPIFVIGSLVHNSDVVKKIEELGVRKIDSKMDLGEFIKNNKIGTLVITAHGDGPSIYETAKKNRIEVIDTTCPKVIKAQRLAHAYSKRGSGVIIFGEKNHKEVIGISEWAGQSGKVVENIDEARKLELPSQKRHVLFSQTTQNLDKFEEIKNCLSQKNSELEAVDTICLATHNRQNELRKIAGENEVVVVIGSPESSNSNRLFEIAREKNPHSYFVEKAKELKKEWFAGKKRAAVSAGASTPDWIIKEVIEEMEKM